MVDIVTSIPILMFFMVAWLIFFILAMFIDVPAPTFDENKKYMKNRERSQQIERKLMFHGFSIAMTIFIIAFSIIQVCYISVTGTQTVVNSEAYVHCLKLSKAFLGLFIIQSIYFLRTCLKIGVWENPILR